LNPTGATKNIVFKLKAADNDMGLRNLLFIFFICILILTSVVCCTFFIVGGCQISCPCAQWFAKKKNSSFGSSNKNYRFSLLTRKAKKTPLLFDDEFDDDEAEDILFSPNLSGRYQFFNVDNLKI
jgi:hypothetical protein